MFNIADIVLYGAEETGISAVFMAIGIIGLIFLLLLKVASLSSGGRIYEMYHIFTTFVFGILCFFFVIIGQLINQTITFNVYLLLCIGIFSAVVLLTVAEVILMFASRAVTGDRRRIDRTERKNSGWGL